MWWIKNKSLTFQGLNCSKGALNTKSERLSGIILTDLLKLQTSESVSSFQEMKIWKYRSIMQHDILGSWTWAPTKTNASKWLRGRPALQPWLLFMSLMAAWSKHRSLAWVLSESLEFANQIQDFICLKSEGLAELEEFGEVTWSQRGCMTVVDSKTLLELLRNNLIWPISLTA